MADYRREAFREFVEALLKDKRCLFTEGNVLYCDKLFIINGVVNRIYEMLVDDEANLEEVTNYLDYINMFIDDRVDIFWEHGQFVVHNKE